MTERWKQKFDFYMGRLSDGEPCLITLDLAAEEHTPLASHPQRANVRITMQSPDQDGLRSREEADALFALEDKLVEGIAKLDAIYIGRIVTGGITDCVFYLPDETDPAKLAKVADSVRGEYELECTLDSDPDWSLFHNFMWPNPYQMEIIQNRQILQQLAQRGDDPTTPRQVEHFLYFTDTGAAQAAREKLTGLGFKIPEPKSQDSRYLLQLSREEALADGRIDDVVCEILDVVLEHDGYYDGWGCEVSKT